MAAKGGPWGTHTGSMGGPWGPCVSPWRSMWRPWVAYGRSMGPMGLPHGGPWGCMGSPHGGPWVAQKDVLMRPHPSSSNLISQSASQSPPGDFFPIYRLLDKLPINRIRGRPVYIYIYIYGMWYVVYGIWYMVYGIWLVVCSSTWVLPTVPHPLGTFVSD